MFPGTLFSQFLCILFRLSPKVVVLQRGVTQTAMVNHAHSLSRGQMTLTASLLVYNINYQMLWTIG